MSAATLTIGIDPVDCQYERVDRSSYASRAVRFRTLRAVHIPPRGVAIERSLACTYAASLALTRATVAADHTAAPAGVGKPSAVSFAASARSDSEPSGSSRAMIGASDAACPFALVVRAALAPARARASASYAVAEISVRFTTYTRIL
jgi:hypothetical protein